MTAKELMEELSHVDPDTVVMVAMDEEGDEFNSVEELTIAYQDEMGDLYKYKQGLADLRIVIWPGF